MRDIITLIGLKQEDKDVDVNTLVDLDTTVDTDANADMIARQDSIGPSYPLGNQVKSMLEKTVHPTLEKCQQTIGVLKKRIQLVMKITKILMLILKKLTVQFKHAQLACLSR